MSKAWKSFESRIAKYLEEIYKKQGLKFGRVPCSGAMASRHTRLIGDVYCMNDDKFPYFIECKERKELSLWGLMRKQKMNQIEGWFEKARRQAKTVSKKPILFITKLGAGFPDLVVCEYTFTIAEMNIESSASCCILVNKDLSNPIMMFPKNENQKLFKRLFAHTGWEWA